MKLLTWQNPEQLFVAQELIKIVNYFAADLRCIKKAALGLPLKLLLFSDFHFRHTISLVVTKQTKKLTRGTLQITVLANGDTGTGPEVNPKSWTGSFII